MSEMSSRALLLAAAPGEALPAAALDAARAALSDFVVIEDRALDPGVAHEFLFAAAGDIPIPTLRARLATDIAQPGLDVAVVADDSALRAKALLVADMESTIIEQEMLDELADFIGARERISEITERAMRGELDFEQALDERVGLLKGLDASVLDAVAARITLMPGAETLVRTMKLRGAHCALVSGGFTVFTERVARRLGFDEHQANVLEIEDRKLTGRVVRPILGRQAKKEALLRIAAQLGIDPAQAAAVGDGANDLAMLEAAGLGVAFRAKPAVRDAVAGLPGGAVVTHGDLTMLLHLQGFERSAFADR